MSARRISRRFGMLASDFTQCQYLTTKDSMPCNILPALVKYVRLIAVLKTQPLDFFKIQDLRVLTLIHNILWLQGNSSVTSREKPSYPAQTATMISHVVRALAACSLSIGSIVVGLPFSVLCATDCDIVSCNRPTLRRTSPRECTGAHMTQRAGSTHCCCPYMYRAAHMHTILSQSHCTNCCTRCCAICHATPPSAPVSIRTFAPITADCANRTIPPVIRYRCINKHD